MEKIYEVYHSLLNYVILPMSFKPKQNKTKQKKKKQKKKKKKKQWTYAHMRSITKPRLF